MGNAVQRRPAQSTSTNTPQPADSTAQRASFSDGLASSSPSDTYAAQNPEASPAKLSAGSGDLTLKPVVKKKKDSLGGTASSAGGGASVNAKEKSGSVTAKGTSGKHAANGTVGADLRDDGSLESASASGGYTHGGTGGAGGGKAEFDEQGRMSGLAADGKAQAGGVSLGGSLSMGYSTTAPRAEGEAWKVDWDYDASIGLSGGKFKSTAASNGNPASSTSGSLSAGASANRGGTKSFATKKAADEWRVSFSAGDPAIMSSLTSVDALQDGESLGDSSAFTAGASLSGKAGQFNVGVSASGEKGSGWSLIRQGSTYLLVVKRHTKMKTTFEGSTAGIIKLSMGTANRTADSFAMRFDPKKAGHSRAMSSWINRGVIDGGDFVYIETGAEHDDTSGVSILGVKYAFVGTTGKKTVKYADGSSVETMIGQSNEGVSVPLLLKHDESHKLTATTDGDGTSYSLGTQVESDSVTSAQKAMAQASGSGTWGAGSEAESSGQWSVTSKFSNNQIDEFVAWVVGGTARPRLGMIGSAWLVDSLSKAGSNKDAQREALTQFVASGGGKALAVVHEQISGGTESFPMLAGDGNFLGEDGWGRLDGQTSTWESQQGDANLAADIAADAAAAALECGARIKVIGDRNNYDDLPQNLRSQEESRNVRMQWRLNKVAAAAKESAQAKIVAKIGVAKKQERPPESELKTAQGGAIAVKMDLSGLRAEVDALHAALQTEKAAALDAKRLYDKSVFQHTHHTGGRSVSPKDAFGSAGLDLFGVAWGAGLHSADYKAAEAAGDKGVAALARASSSEASAARQEADYLQGLMSDRSTAIQAARQRMGRLRLTTGQFETAKDHFASSDHAYRQIARDTRGKFNWRSGYP